MSQARSLWRLELARTKWSGGFINWYHPMRIRHLTTGRYLCVNETNELYLVRKEDATISSSTFGLRQEKDDLKVVLEDKDLEIIGAPIIKYGDSTVIMQHAESGLWVSYKVMEMSNPSDSVLIVSIFFRLMRQRKRAWAKSRRNKPFSTKKEKWTTAWTSAEVKRRSREQLVSSGSAVLFSPNSSSTV